MQTMNTDQQTFYPNSTGPYYLSNGIDQRKFFYIKKFILIFFYFIFIDFPMRNPNTYASTPRMPQQVKTCLFFFCILNL